MLSYLGRDAWQNPKLTGQSRRPCVGAMSAAEVPVNDALVLNYESHVNIGKPERSSSDRFRVTGKRGENMDAPRAFIVTDRTGSQGERVERIATGFTVQRCRFPTVVR